EQPIKPDNSRERPSTHRRRRPTPPSPSPPARSHNHSSSRHQRTKSPIVSSRSSRPPRRNYSPYIPLPP
ncbi:unnamed protein product, partial [Rotaria socialis]